ncbi:Snf7 family [Parasponia andersonii]|uniref:Snf7 family n=1 Tax=Parasponia andersonii TaxID=3476 RepID=A0A2P5B380_PARAD|nr:Snf7 family [Parasponia andersonii]
MELGLNPTPTPTPDPMLIREYIGEKVGDWDNEVACRARFKDFSGQRSDWQPIFLFWRDLILNIARHFRLVLLRPSQVKKEWFNRGGLTPLCLDHVLLVMYNEGDIVPIEQLLDPIPTTGPLSQVFRKVRNFMLRLGPIITIPQSINAHDVFIVMSVLKDKAAHLIDHLSQTHWTSSAIITISRFHQICGCGGAAVDDEASATLSFLSAQGKALHFSLNKGDIIQGVKVSLSASPVSSISSLDCDILHLIWTTEKLEQQLIVIDQRCERSRKSAVASLNSGNKNVALRHMRALKLANESREKCVTLLNRVEEVLTVIGNAESTKKVTEAIKSGAQAIKEHKISVKEVQRSLEELEESIDLQKQVESALESSPSYTSVEDEDIEEEFKKLELEIGSGNPRGPIPQVVAHSAAGETEGFESAEALADAFSNLKFVDGSSSQAVAAKETKKSELEAA